MKQIFEHQWSEKYYVVQGHYVMSDNMSALKVGVESHTHCRAQTPSQDTAKNSPNHFFHLVMSRMSNLKQE